MLVKVNDTANYTTSQETISVFSEGPLVDVMYL